MFFSRRNHDTKILIHQPRVGCLNTYRNGLPWCALALFRLIITGESKSEEFGLVTSHSPKKNNLGNYQYFLQDLSKFSSTR